MREMQILLRALQEDPSFDLDRLNALGSSKHEHLAGNCSEATLTSSTDPFTSEQTFSKPRFLDDLHYLSSTIILSKFCISVYDSNFMGAFLKCYNPNAVHHIDLLSDAKNCHVDVITSMKGLFDVRHFCYSCHKAFSTVKDLCAASCCMLCRQPGCLNRTGFINISPTNITTTTTTTTISSQGSFQSKSLQFQCDRCRLKLRTEKCLDCHVSSGICHLYTLCPSCNNTVAKRALSNHICSKKRCTVCALYYPIADCKVNSHKLAEHQCFVQKPINHNKAASVNSGVIQDFQTQTIDDGVMRREPAHQGKIDLTAAKRPKTDEDGLEGMEKNIVRSCPSAEQKPSDDFIWVFDIETDQSCAKEGLLAAESLVGEEKFI